MTLPRLLGSRDKHGHTHHKGFLGCRGAERAAGLQEFRSLHEEPIHTHHRRSGEELPATQDVSWCWAAKVQLSPRVWLRREHFQISTTKACCWDTVHSRKWWRCWAEAKSLDRWWVSTAARSHFDAFPFDVFQRKKITSCVSWCLINSHT